jgi:ACS family hexuronate transporter-like MFS transporter
MPKLMIRGLRWWMIPPVMLGAMVNYLTSSTLSVAAPMLLKDLHIGPQEYFWINATFQDAIMLQPFCGYVLDVVGLKNGLCDFRRGLVPDKPAACAGT